MKKFFTAILAGLALGGAQFAVAQQASCNLVINGNFDTQKVSSPSGKFSNVFSQNSNQFTGMQADELAAWHASNLTTPEYFATNSPLPQPVGTSIAWTNPASSLFGRFDPVGFGTSTYNSSAHNGCLGLINFSLREFYLEYASEELAAPLRGDRDYYAVMKVYNASGSKYASPIGLDLTTTNPTTLTNNPNFVSNNGSGYYVHSGCGIQNTLVTASAWTVLNASFHGVNGAKYLNIGHFGNPNTSNYNNYPLVRPTANGYEPSTAYYYVDDVEVYQVPTAGPNQENPISCNGTAFGPGVTLGDGCSIPGATYAWRLANKFAPVFATTPQVTVNPTVTAVYQLIVTLPNNTTYLTSVTVKAVPAPAPVITALLRDNSTLAQHEELCRFRTVTFTVSDYLVNPVWSVMPPSNPSDYVITYDPANPYQFQLKSLVPDGTGWRLKQIGVQANGTDICNNPISAAFFFDSRYADAGGGICPLVEDDARVANPSIMGPSSAYPNPANESLTVPKEMTTATLLNSQGKLVGQADALGKVDTRNLPAGLYNLRMQQNGKTVNQRIEVKH